MEKINEVSVKISLEGADEVIEKLETIKKLLTEINSLGLVLKISK